jgi:hypothetical protein
MVITIRYGTPSKRNKALFNKAFPQYYKRFAENAKQEAKIKKEATTNTGKRVRKRDSVKIESKKLKMVEEPISIATEAEEPISIDSDSDDPTTPAQHIQKKWIFWGAKTPLLGVQNVELVDGMCMRTNAPATYTICSGNAFSIAPKATEEENDVQDYSILATGFATVAGKNASIVEKCGLAWLLCKDPSESWLDMDENHVRVVQTTWLSGGDSIVPLYTRLPAAFRAHLASVWLQYTAKINGKKINRPHHRHKQKFMHSTHKGVLCNPIPSTPPAMHTYPETPAIPTEPAASIPPITPAFPSQHASSTPPAAHGLPLLFYNRDASKDVKVPKTEHKANESEAQSMQTASKQLACKPVADERYSVYNDIHAQTDGSFAMQMAMACITLQTQEVTRVELEEKHRLEKDKTNEENRRLQSLQEKENKRLQSLQEANHDLLLKNLLSKDAPKAPTTRPRQEEDSSATTLDTRVNMLVKGRATMALNAFAALKRKLRTADSLADFQNLYDNMLQDRKDPEYNADDYISFFKARTHQHTHSDSHRFLTTTLK